MTDALLLRDAIHTRLATAFVIPWARVGKVPVPSVQPADLPYLAVYFAEEQMSSLGDGGPPGYLHQTTIVIEMAAKDGEPAGAEQDLDAWMHAAKTRLLTDPAFVTMSEQIVSIRVTRAVPREGEFFFAIMRMALTLQYRSFWEPNVTDNFETVRFDGRFPSADTDPDAVQQVGAEWDIPQ